MGKSSSKSNLVLPLLRSSNLFLPFLSESLLLFPDLFLNGLLLLGLQSSQTLLELCSITGHGSQVGSLLVKTSVLLLEANILRLQRANLLQFCRLVLMTKMKTEWSIRRAQKQHSKQNNMSYKKDFHGVEEQSNKDLQRQPGAALRDLVPGREHYRPSRMPARSPSLVW